MKKILKKEENYNGLDCFRIAAALLVVAIHTSPLTAWSEGADFFLTRVLARVAVPFFLMVTGQFLLSEILYKKQGAFLRVRRYLKKLLLLYGISILLYLPIGIYAGHYKNITGLSLIKMFLFDGTFYHLWYFPACILGVLLLCLLSRFLGIRGVFAVSGFLYMVGLFGDSYFGLTQEVPVLAAVYEKGFLLWSYTRNGLFLAPVFLALGATLGKGKKCKKKTYAYIGFLISFLLMTAEAFTLRYLKLQRHDSMYLMLVPTMIFLYQILLQVTVRNTSRIKFSVFRTLSMVIYIIHPAMIVAVRAIAKISGIHMLSDHSLIHYLCVSLLSVAAALMVVWCKKRIVCRTRTDGMELAKVRTWIEIDKNALEQNVEFLNAKLPENCRLMPVLKANAYGHGAILLAKELCGMGIESFCVASVQEGKELRGAGIGGEILVLGMTHPSQFDLLLKYHLSQTVIDYSYAKKLKEYGKKVHVHIGIDTGMHRLGERCENIGQICKIFEMPNLIADGIFTHLSADDILKKPQQEFTFHQAAQFYDLLEELKRRGIKIPKVHIQASYGALNYPDLKGDYARIGIALYGVLSTKEDTYLWKEKLSPVLSLKTRVAAVKEIYAGETAGYGLSFCAEHTMKLAVLAIGYADGLPRALSDGNGAVLIHGNKAPIIGKICMDQTIVDVSAIADVRAGDIAVVIGRSKEMEISVCDVAEQAGTITNEILSRMGTRPKRVIANGN